MERESLGGSIQTSAVQNLWKAVVPALAGLIFFSGTSAMLGKDEKSIQNLRDAIIKLGPNVDPAEAEAVSVTAHHTARQLARDYRVVGPAEFQNFLIHIGARKRGYCWHWARDIGTRLKELRLKTLYLHWGAADADNHLEHNVIVVTAQNQAFVQGYLIDGWRNAGRLYWLPVVKDSDYVWREDLRETAWLHDYELVQKPSPPKKPVVQQKPRKATASLEIRD